MVTSSERRKHSRSEVPCRLRIEGPGGNDVRARTINVCDGGVYFVVDKGLELGREVYVQLTVPRDTANTFFLEQFATHAQVLRCDHPAPGQTGTGVALKFAKELALDLL